MSPKPSRAGPSLREAVRASHPRMVVARLHRALIRLQPRYLPQSPLGQALGYARNQWPVLDRILAHGEVELDNNLCYDARVINQVMPPPDLCRVAKPEAHIPAVPDFVAYQSAA